MFIVAHWLCECESCRKRRRCGCSCTGCYNSIQQLCKDLSQFQLSGATGGAPCSAAWLLAALSPSLCRE